MSDVAKLEKNLQKLTEEGAEPGQILNMAERVLSLKPNNRVALQIKVVCRMYQEKFGAAIEVLDHLVSSDKSCAQLPAVLFQRAYCLYRMQQVAEAKRVLEASPGLTTHVPSQHLMAQIHYNLEAYAAAAAIYKQLLESRTYRDEQEQAELMGNYTAALAMSDKPTEALQVVRTADEKTADLLYNAAAAQIESRDYAAAQQMLTQAEAAYRVDHSESTVRSLADVLALSADEADALLGPVTGTDPRRAATRAFFDDVASTWVQIAYVAYCQGDEARAGHILELVLRAKPTSTVTTAMASLNLTALRTTGKQDFFDSQKRLKAAQQPKVTARLTTRQRVAVRYNGALLNLQFGSINITRRMVEQMTQDDPKSELTVSLRLALALHDAKKKKQQSAEELIREYVQGQTQRGGNTQLVAAQLYLEQGELQQAVTALQAAAQADQALANVPSTPATVAAWQVQLGDVKGAVATLEAAVKAHGSDIGTAESLLVWAVHFLATSRRLYKEAADLVQACRAAVPALAKKPEVTALWMVCLSHTDMAAARACGKELGAASTSSSSAAAKLPEARLETLQKQNPGKEAMAKLGYQRQAADGGAAAKAGAGGRRRRAMRRPAKNMEGKPDPERWVPMAARSYVKDLPERRKRELKRLRALDQEQKRRAAEKKKKTQNDVAAPAE